MRTIEGQGFSVPEPPPINDSVTHMHAVEALRNLNQGLRWRWFDYYKRILSLYLNQQEKNKTTIKTK